MFGALGRRFEHHFIWYDAYSINNIDIYNIFFDFHPFNFRKKSIIVKVLMDIS